jgi:hypothetical protein
VVDGVLEDGWDRTVVFGRDEQQTLYCGDLGLQPFDLGRLAGIIVLIVEREVADLRLLEREVGWGKLRDGLASFALDESRRRLPTMAAMLIWLMSLPSIGTVAIKPGYLA